MMIRVSSSLSLATFALASMALSGCLSPGIMPTTESDSGTESESGTSTTGTTETSTTEATETTETTMTTMSTSTTSPGVCGDGSVDAGEECDDGGANGENAACTSECLNNICGDGKLLEGEEQCDDGNTADGDGCTAECLNNTCGDGIVYEGVELCDDGINDGSYGGCMDNCLQLGPYCGDGFLQEAEEDCDSLDIATGCLSTCKQAKSCLEIIDDTPGAPTGAYKVSPETYEGEPLDVWCEMEIDGGGYTFLKYTEGVSVTAAKAEVTCAGLGMRLFVPRSPEHLAKSWEVATTDNVMWYGEGISGVGDEFVSFFGIYPVEVGTSCPDMPFNSVDCPEWAANDGEAYFISAASQEDGEPSTNSCVGCSAGIFWNPDGTLLGYQALKFGGGKSPSFFCDVGDKLP